MSTGLHSGQGPTEGIHVLHHWSVADATARLALSVVPADVGRVARQADTGEFYVLTDDSPMTWGQLSAPAGSAAPTFGAVLITPTSETAFNSIGAALAAASAGELVRVGPGVYVESITIPTSVRVTGLDGARIQGAAAGGTRVTMGEGSECRNLDVDCPNDATPAVAFAGSTACAIHDFTFFGGGASGGGIKNTGTGTLFVNRARLQSGTVGTLLEATAGLVQVNILFIQTGTVTTGISVSGSAKVEAINIEFSDVATLTTAFLVGAGILTVQGGQATATQVLQVTSNSADVNIASGFRFLGSTWDILVDAGVTSAEIKVLFCELEGVKISADDTLRASDNWALLYSDSLEGDHGMRVEGELTVGTPEGPREAVFGEGDSYVNGMVVLTTDSTASASVDGGNLTDVSDDAASASGSTFGFQGVTAGHAILLGSERKSAGAVVKHWGHKVSVVTAAVEVTPRSFLYEIWNGTAWVEIGVLATHSSLFHRYGNECFLRANNSEHTRYGVDDSTAWATKTINGKTLYWSRLRILTTVTTAPTFQQWKVHSSRSEINGDGTVTFHGLSRFSTTLTSGGNAFGESGGVAGFSKTVGSGGLPTGWAHDVKNSALSIGDGIYFQFPLPRGIDTSFPVKLDVTFGVTVSSSPTAGMDVIASMLPVEVSGVMEADPAGGVTPVARTLANCETLTGKAGQAKTNTVDDVNAEKVHRTTFVGYDVSDYYEGDLTLWRVEYDDDGPDNPGLRVYTVEVSGVSWTLGEHL